MKITHLQLLHPQPDGFVMGRVVVETWLGFKVESREVFRESWSPFWKWLDSGQFVEGSDLNNLERSAKAKSAMKGNSL